MKHGRRNRGVIVPPNRTDPGPTDATPGSATVGERISTSNPGDGAGVSESVY